VLGWLFRLAKAIPVAPQKEDPSSTRRRSGARRQVLRDGDLLAIFPEGADHARRRACRSSRAGDHEGAWSSRAAEGVEPPVIPNGAHQPVGFLFSRIEQGARHGAGRSGAGRSAAWD
jgi:1-acyl-sn-glycerol-3-phosphate acyltransferase